MFSLSKLIGALWLAVALCFGNSSLVSAGAISGIVIDSVNVLPIAGVDIAVLSVIDSAVAGHATTDTLGAFNVTGIPTGEYRVRLLLMGYRPLVRGDIRLLESDQVVSLGELRLAASPISLPGVQIEGSGVILSSDRTTYLTKSLPTIGNSATDLLRVIPEVSVDINDRVSFRGTSGVSIQIDGRPSPLKGDALATYLRQFPADRIDRIEVIPHPSAKYDPEGPGGIINLITARQKALGSGGNATLALGNRSAGPSVRSFLKQGHISLDGGLSGQWNWLEYTYDDTRTVNQPEPFEPYKVYTLLKRQGSSGSADISCDLMLSSRSTLYGTLTGYTSATIDRTADEYDLRPAPAAEPTIYGRDTREHTTSRSWTGVLGVQHSIEKTRNEWNLELQRSETPSNYSAASQQVFDVPMDSLGRSVGIDRGSSVRVQSVQADRIHPVGKEGRLEVGVRGEDRFESSGGIMRILNPPTSPDPSSRYEFEARYYSTYATFAHKIKEFSYQLGVRGELAQTTLDSRSSQLVFEQRYSSIFPSFSVLWQRDAQRSVRLVYSKRIERPRADRMTPDDLSLDPINVYVGNPNLQPKYTHSIAADFTISNKRGLLRFSPYYRVTAHSWDQFKTVDSVGAATTTWRNAASVQSEGLMVVANLAQQAMIGGGLTVSLFRETHDASNLGDDLYRRAINWSMDGNVTVKLSPSYDVQSNFRYRAGQTLAQGSLSGVVYTNIGVRYKPSEVLWIRLGVSDPFNVWRYTYSVDGATFHQRSSNRGSTRRYGLTCGWSWGGKASRLKQRQEPEQAQSDGTLPVR